MGFTAGLLVAHEKTGVAALVSNVTKSPIDWKVGGVSIEGMLSRNANVVESESVNLEGQAFQVMKSNFKFWSENNRY